MLKIIKKQKVDEANTEAENWFGAPNITQDLNNSIYFKEWHGLTDSEILQVHYHGLASHVSIKIISKNSVLMVNDVVTWSMQLSERQALDHLVQNNPKSYLSFHPDIDNLFFTNMEPN